MNCCYRQLNGDIEKNRIMASLIKFMDQYVDTIKFTEKIKSNFYMTEFDPLADYNLEFIFRQILSIFDVLENEKIASVSTICLYLFVCAHLFTRICLLIQSHNFLF